MRKILFTILVLFTISAFPQSNDLPLTVKLDTLLSGKFFHSTQIGIDVYDLTSNKTLYQKNEKLLLNPASNLKLITTSAALEFLGAYYNFKTRVCYTGEILNGTLYGDMYVIGGCDPDFTVQNLDSLAMMVKQKGIKKVTGNLYFDTSMTDSLFWGNGWMWDDDPSTDAPYLTSLCINENSVGVIVKPFLIGEPPLVKLVPSSNYFDIENNAVTVPADSPNTISVTRDWINRTNNIIINGNINDQLVPDSLTDTTRVNVYKPELLFQNLFCTALTGERIKLKGKSLSGTAPFYAQPLAEIDRPLKNILPHLNKTSYNLGAEMFLYALAEQFFGKPATTKNGVKMEDSLITLIGCNPSDYRIVDGSGVSRYNLISPELIISLLKFIYFHRPEIYNLIYSSLPIAGVDGTLKNRMIGTPAQDNVHAKTGTLSGTSCLSGYLNSNDGHLIAFSIMIQNYVGGSQTAHDIQDAVCNMLIKR